MPDVTLYEADLRPHRRREARPDAAHRRGPAAPREVPLHPVPGLAPAQGELVEFEDRWTGGYIFENEWQSFRTRQNRELELKTSEHAYQRAGRYTVGVKVVDIFGNDTMTLVSVSVG